MATTTSASERDLSSMTDIMEEVGRKAADHVCTAFDGHAGATSVKAGIADVAMQARIDTQHLIVDALRDEFPHDSCRGAHESLDVEGESGVTFVVDALDGTRNYAQGIRWCAISIGAVIAGVPVAGVVINPISGDVYRASRGSGATRNGRALTVAALPPHTPPMLLTGTTTGRRSAEVQWKYVVPKVQYLTGGYDMRRMGSEALDVLSSLQGLYFHAGFEDHDVAAAWIVAEEAGARLVIFESGWGVPGIVSGHPDLVAAYASSIADVYGCFAELLDGQPRRRRIRTLHGLPVQPLGHAATQRA